MTRQHTHEDMMSIEKLMALECALKGKMIRIPSILCTKQTDGLVVAFGVREVSTVESVTPCPSGWKVQVMHADGAGDFCVIEPSHEGMINALMASIDYTVAIFAVLAPLVDRTIRWDGTDTERGYRCGFDDPDYVDYPFELEVCEIRYDGLEFIISADEDGCEDTARIHTSADGLDAVRRLAAMIIR